MVHVLVQIAKALNTTVEELVPPTEMVTPTRKMTTRLKKLEQPEREWVTRILAPAGNLPKKG
jgi:hypothetical protein